MDTSVNEMGRGSLLKIIHVAIEDTADELSELNVTNEAIDELDELVVDDEVNNQLRGSSLSSLRTWNQNIGYLCSTPQKISLVSSPPYVSQGVPPWLHVFAKSTTSSYLRTQCTSIAHNLPTISNRVKKN